MKKYQGHGLDLSELVAIGNEGLLKAVRKFDPDQGVKFISYAVWWVRQAVLKALAEQTRKVESNDENARLLAELQVVLKTHEIVGVGTKILLSQLHNSVRALS